MYKRYYSPFEEQPIRKEVEPEIIKPQKVHHEEVKMEEMEEIEEKVEKKKSHKSDFFSNISNDDLILLGILVLLLMEEKESRDIPLVLGIAFLLLMGYIEKD